MASPLESLLSKYAPRSPEEYENAFKEIIQELTLAGLARADFFNKAAFYGGSALRIFYGLSRFSEDLDFTLLESDSSFKLDPYFSSISESLRAFGLSVEIVEKDKSEHTRIESAFLKANTKIHLLKVRAAAPMAQKVPGNRALTVKFEVDTSPPTGFECEVKPLLPPISSSVRVLKRSSLFAGKVHAVLFRSWQKRVKGRDFYDLLWFLGQRIPVRLAYIQEKMIASGAWPDSTPLDREDLMALLVKRIESIEWEAAKQDIVRFLKNPDELTPWGKEYFLSAVSQLLVE